MGSGQDFLVINNIVKDLNIKYLERTINLCNKTSVILLSKVIEDANMLIGTDSCAIHIAAAVGTNNLCIMGGGQYGRFYPYGDLNINKIIFSKMECYGCEWRCKYNKALCIQDILVEDVWKMINIE